MAAKAKTNSDTTDEPPKGAKSTPAEPVHVPSSWADRVAPHAKQIAIGIGVVLAVIGAFLVYRSMQGKKARKASVALLEAVDTAGRPVEAPKAADAPDAPPTETPDEDSGGIKFPSVRERAEAALAALRKARAVGSRATSEAGLLEASLLIDAGQLDDAAKVYTGLSGAGGDTGVLAREGLGFVLEAKARAATDPAQRQQLYEQASAAFAKAQPDVKGPRHDHALYNQARILAILGKRDEARKLLEQALEIEGVSDLHTDIEARLAQLEAP